MGVTKELAKFLVQTSYSDLPRKAVELSKERILDTLGVALAGAKAPAGQIGIKLVKSWGGQAISTVVGGGFKTCPSNAAFANGLSAHTIDYDDTCTNPVGHHSNSLVPAILALSEQENTSGKKLIEAYILGYEVGTRIGMTAPECWDAPWHCVATWPTLGNAAAGAKLMRLSVDQARAALGIAASAAGGIRKAFGTNTKPLHAGYGARDGVVAALLAGEGFTANMDVLERDPDVRPTSHLSQSFPYAFWGERYDVNKVNEGLGTYYKLVVDPTITKFHPGPTGTNAYLDLLLGMMKSQGFKAEDVEAIDGEVTSAFNDTQNVFHDPANRDQSRYSLGYQLAVAILDGKVGIDQHTEERIHRPDIKTMMERIHLNEHPVASPGAVSIKDVFVGRLTVRLKDGRKFSGEQDATNRPPSRDDLLAKYRDCAERVLSRAQVERSIELIWDLENVKDIGKLTHILIGKKG